MGRTERIDQGGYGSRRYELATLAAARRLRSSYCCLAHRVVLRERFAEPVVEIARDHRAAGLDEVDVAVMDLAEQVVDDAGAIGDANLQRLRDLGLSETEIMDVVLAAAARCFFSKTLDALDVRADASYRELEPELQGPHGRGRSQLLRNRRPGGEAERQPRHPRRRRLRAREGVLRGARVGAALEAQETAFFQATAIVVVALGSRQARADMGVPDEGAAGAASRWRTTWARARRCTT